MSFLDILYTVIPALFFYSAPLIYTALGGVFSERSGVVNIALEGLMMIGACTAVIFNLTFAETFGNATPWLALIVAMVIAGLFSLLHALASVSFRADQVVSGVALNMIALALTLFVVKSLYGAGQTETIAVPFSKQGIPLLKKIPLLGETIFNNFYWTSWIAIAVAIVAWIVLLKTPFGLRLRAVGEHPAAAETQGINVIKTRYLAILISGILGGLGGAVYVNTISLDYSFTTISGQGFIALAAMIFGKWHPLGAMGAALFFGLAQSLGVVGSLIPGIKEIPNYYLLIFPYVLTILALSGVIGRSEAPSALGVPYVKGKR